MMFVLDLDVCDEPPEGHEQEPTAYHAYGPFRTYREAKAWGEGNMQLFAVVSYADVNCGWPHP